MAQLEANNVTVEYLMKRTGQRVTAVQGASFTVEKGQFVAIVGGCGKTTLLNVIAGLLPVTAGTIEPSYMNALAEALTQGMDRIS